MCISTVTGEGFLLLNRETVFALGRNTAMIRTNTFHHLITISPHCADNKALLEPCSCEGKADSSAGEENRGKEQAVLSFCICICV